MNEATTRTLTQMEKILSLDNANLRIQFFRPDEGMRIYHIYGYFL